jgi:hypothetical protein
VPNTLCHIGIQGPFNRLTSPRIDLRLMVVGCIIPDLPWIFLKTALAFHFWDPFHLRLYFTIQATLACCLLFSAGLAFLTRNVFISFAVTGVNCLLHLLLDSLEIKWGNGVHLFAPFNWHAIQFNLLWPDNLVILGCTIWGLFCLLLFWRPILRSCRPIVWPSKKKFFYSVCFLVAYLACPLLFLHSLEDSNFYYLKTLHHPELRQGQFVEFDRVHYFAKEKELQIFSGERIGVTGKIPDQSGRVTLQGHFISPHVYQVDDFHILHADRDRKSTRLNSSHRLTPRMPSSA